MNIEKIVEWIIDKVIDKNNDQYFNQFKLSYTFERIADKKEIHYPQDMKQEEFPIYLEKNFKNLGNDNKSELTNDLIVFRIYRDNIIQNLEDLNFFDKILDKILLLLSVIAAVIVSKNLITIDYLREARGKLDILVKTGGDTKKIEDRIQFLLEYYDKWSYDLFKVLLVAFFICVFSCVLFYLFRIRKKSLVRKLICVNNTIYKLEAIKEKKIDENKNFSVNSCNSNEELKDSSSVKVNADDKNKNNKNKNKNKNKKR